MKKIVDVEEIREMKELGIVKRKNEIDPKRYEYSFKIPCKVCGQPVEWCFCTQTLEDAKKVIEEAKHTCLACYGKPENMSASDRETMETLMKEAEDGGYPLTWDEAYEELQGLWADYYDGEPHQLEDGTEYVDCECPVDLGPEHQDWPGDDA